MSLSLIEKILKNCAISQNKIAIYHDQECISYQELGNRILKYRTWLNKKELKGKKIALHLGRTPNTIAFMLACWSVNATYIPLDPKQPQQRKGLILSQCKADKLIIDNDKAFDELKDFHPELLPALIANKPNNTWLDTVTPNRNQIGYILYTSGSTGIPKGIAISCQNIDAFIKWALSQYDKYELNCVLAATTFTFDLSLFEIMVPLSLGTSIYLVDSILNLVENHNQLLTPISLINTVPSAIRELYYLNAIPRSVQTINLAGEVLTKGLVYKLYQLPTIKKVYNLWGPTESTTYASSYLCPKVITTNTVPIGKAISGSEIYILNNKKLKKSSNVEGELVIKGQGLALGYYKNKELTDEKFISIDKERVYKTGDLGFIDTNGLIYYKGRIDNQVKIRGFRIELEDIENSLYQIEEVKEVVVTVNQQRNQSEIFAAIQCFSPDENTLSTIKSEIQKRLPYYMIPSHWHLTNNKLPTNANGKLCRKRILALFDKNDSSKRTNDLFYQYVRQTLGHSFNKKLNFYENGGNSLQLLRLLYLLQNTWEKTPHLNQLANQPLIWVENNLYDKRNDKATYNSLEQYIPDSEKRFWKIINQAPKSDAYNNSLIFYLNGALDSNKLVACFKGIINQLPTLNHGYSFTDNRLSRTKLNTAVKILENDYYSLDDATRCLLLEKVKQTLFTQPFDLSKGPLIRLAIIKLHHQAFCLLFCTPHLVSDGLAIDSFFQMVSKAYREGQTPLIKQEIKISDNYKRQKKLAIQYWQQVFNKPLANINWPRLIKSNDSIQQQATLSKELKHHLESVAVKSGVKLPALLLSLWNILLYRFGLGEDKCIALPVANRCAETNQNLMVNLSNTLPLRLIIKPTMSFKQAIAMTNKHLLDAISYQDISIDKVFEKLKGDNLENKLFSLIFSYMDFALDSIKLPGIDTKGHFYFQKSAKAPLVLSVIKSNENSLYFKLEAKASYVSKLFINSLLACYIHALKQITINLDRKVATLDILPKSQLEMITSHLQSKKQFKPQSLSQKLIDSCHKFQKKIAIIENDKQITYQTLFEDAINIAKNLISQGIPTDSAIAVSMPKSYKLITTLLGILLHGSYYIPIDGRNPRSRTEFILNDANASFVISDKEISLPTELLFYYDLVKKPIKDINLADISPNQLAYIIYTSGTTGQPKGVQITQNNILRLFSSVSSWSYFNSNDVWTFFHSYAFDFSVWEVFGALLFGGKLIIVPDKEVANIDKVISLINQHKVSIFNQTPTAFKNFSSHLDKLQHQPRMIIFGGEKFEPYLLHTWWKHFNNSPTQFINMYGITETTVHASFKKIDSKINNSNIGKPLDDMSMIVIDSNNQPCPIGVKGELLISGSGLSQGYHNQPLLTKNKFTKERYLNCNKTTYYHSGDGVILNSNSDFEYVERLDKQIKLNGIRLEKEEILSVIKKYPGIEVAELKIIEHTGLQLLVAYFQSKININKDFFHDYLKKQLPNYAIPSYLIQVNTFPTTVNGKIDVDKLPLPNVEESQSILPKGSTVCQTIFECWQAVLCAQALSLELGFFEQGGTSIKAALLVNKLNHSFSLQLTLIDIFRFPSIKSQAQKIETLIKQEDVA